MVARVLVKSRGPALARVVMVFSRCCNAFSVVVSVGQASSELSGSDFAVVAMVLSRCCGEFGSVTPKILLLN